MKTISIIIAVFLLSFVQKEYHSQQGVSFNFEKYQEGTIPIAWTEAVTGDGGMCSWKIVNDKNSKVLAQLSTQRLEYRFNVITNNDLSYKDVAISLKFKGVKGISDQGGGPVWRYKDHDNYYVARANPLENNYRLYKVVNGYRLELKSAKVNMQTGKWYSLKITMIENRIQCFFNGKLMMETTDNTFSEAGKIGLWTKSDAVTYFDDLKISPLK